MQFLIESVSVALIGGLAGLALTMALCVAVSAAMPHLPVDFSPALILIGLFVSAGTGIFAGFAPAWNASRLDPVEALRYE
jgi:putative ABC transport system permease protein